MASVDEIAPVHIAQTGRAPQPDDCVYRYEAAEAVTAALDALAAEVAGVEPCCDESAVTLADGRVLRAMCQCGGYVRDAVLAIVRGEER